MGGGYPLEWGRGAPLPLPLPPYSTGDVAVCRRLQAASTSKLISRETTQVKADWFLGLDFL